MILPEDSDCFVFDFDIIAEDEEQETGLEEAVVFNEQPSTSRGRGQTTGSSERGRGRGRGRGRLQSRQENSSRLPCNHPGCDKTYANKTTLRSHKKKHAWTGKQLHMCLSTFEIFGIFVIRLCTIFSPCFLFSFKILSLKFRKGKRCEPTFPQPYSSRSPKLLTA